MEFYKIHHFKSLRDIQNFVSLQLPNFSMHFVFICVFLCTLILYKACLSASILEGQSGGMTKNYEWMLIIPVE